MEKTMTPWDIAKESESSQQKALFAWANCAARYGFDVANDERGYSIAERNFLYDDMNKINWKLSPPVEVLNYLFAIPNGGKRDPITASRMKAEGVKPGVPDIMLPVMRSLPTTDINGRIRYNGLFIELKKPSVKPKRDGVGGVRTEQHHWNAYLNNAGYYARVAYGWLDARDIIMEYLT